MLRRLKQTRRDPLLRQPDQTLLLKRRLWPMPRKQLKMLRRRSTLLLRQLPMLRRSLQRRIDYWLIRTISYKRNRVPLIRRRRLLLSLRGM